MTYLSLGDKGTSCVCPEPIDHPYAAPPEWFDRIIRGIPEGRDLQDWQVDWLRGHHVRMKRRLSRQLHLCVREFTLQRMTPVTGIITATPCPRGLS